MQYNVKKKAFQEIMTEPGPSIWVEQEYGSLKAAS